MTGVHNEFIVLFCAYMAGRSFSDHTIRRRTSSLSSFARFIAPMDLAQVEGAHVEEWIATLGAPRTRHAYRSDLSAFYTWATKRKVVACNPVADTDPIRVPKGLPRPVPIDAVPGIIEACDDPSLRLALALAAFAGLRRSEICNLTTDDFQLHGAPTLVVRGGKGSKDRVVPLHPMLVGAIQRRRFTQGKLFTWSPDVLGRRAADHMKRLGYDCSLHQLRHSYGTEMARVFDGNLVAVGRAMGHANPSTTIGYVGWSGGDVGGRMSGLYVA